MKTLVGTPEWQEAERTVATFEANKRMGSSKPHYDMVGPRDIQFDPETSDVRKLGQQVVAYVLKWPFVWQGIVDYGSTTGWMINRRQLGRDVSWTHMRDLPTNLQLAWEALMDAPLSAQTRREVEGKLYAAGILRMSPQSAAELICRTLLREIES